MPISIQSELTAARSGSLNIDLSSNNPFRNRMPSPAPPPRQISPLHEQALPRPTSRNPFIDIAPAVSQAPPIFTFPSSTSESVMAASVSAPNRDPLPVTQAADMFGNLSLSDKPRPMQMDRSRPLPPRGQSERLVRGPPRPDDMQSGPRHRPSKSQEQAMYVRRADGSNTSKSRGELDIFADPSAQRRSPDKNRVQLSDRERVRRPRRNSHTSVLEKRSLSAEEEKKREERKRREREKRYRERDTFRKEISEKDKNGKPKPRTLDIIDQLDATSIYGTGLFHHDGPFDACRPDRNKAGRRNAPMQAFPKDSLNNVLGGSGPLNKTPNHATFLGNHDDEAFRDYHTTATDTGVFAPYQAGPQMKSTPVVEAFNTKVEPVHGTESMGLGTSTFLEGAPASRKAMARRESETATSYQPEQNGGGLGRKKSMAQKIRGISNSRRDFSTSGPITNPEGAFTQSQDVLTPGGTIRKGSEANPFFNEFAPGKGESITIVEPANRPSRARAPSSPGSIPFSLQRRVTTASDSSTQGELEQKSMGFLSRVKSLKGGKRSAPPRANEKYASSTGQAI